MKINRVISRLTVLCGWKIIELRLLGVLIAFTHLCANNCAVYSSVSTMYYIGLVFNVGGFV